MNEMLKQNSLTLIDNLNYAQIADLQLGKLGIRIEFILDGAEIAVLHLSRVVHFILSQTLDDEGLFAVGELSMTPLHDGGKKVLSALSYRFSDKDDEIFAYPNYELFHFHLEGDICLEVVCGNYQFYEVVPR